MSLNRGPYPLPHISATPGESRAQTLDRMATNARRRSIRVLYRDVTGCWHVSSGLDEIPYRVSPDGVRCECQGFQRNGICTHLAAVRESVRNQSADHSAAEGAPMPLAA